MSLTTNPNPKRGEIWNVSFNPVKGEEIYDVRPAVVVNSDSMASIKLRIVVPVTGKREKHTDREWCIPISPSTTKALMKDSVADALQIRCVSLERFSEYSGKLDADTLQQILDAVSIVLEIK